MRTCQFYLQGTETEISLKNIMSDTNYCSFISCQRDVPINILDETWEHEVLSDDGMTIN